MRQLFTILLVVGLVFAIASQSSAFDFEEEVKKLAAENAEGYLGPFPTAFGTVMNSGLYHSANTHRFFPIPGFDVMVKFSMVQVSDEDLTYEFMVGDSLVLDVSDFAGFGVNELVLNPEILYPNRETPTLFGSSSAEALTSDVDDLAAALLDAGVDAAVVNALRLSGDLDTLASDIPDLPMAPGSGLDMLPMVMPQVSLGLPMNSEIMLRYAPPVEVPKIGGEASFLGIGLKHSISQYIPVPGLLIPDVTVQYVWQQLKVGDLIESTHTAFNIHASYGLNLIVFSITPYIGFGMETSNIKVEYELDKPGHPLHGAPISFDLDGNNKSRITGGVRLGLPIPFLKVTADYSIGEYTAATLGVGISF